MGPTEWRGEINSLMKFFKFDHLPEKLKEASKPFSELAQKIAEGPSNSQSHAALQKLIEAKDCAVRAML